MRNNSRQIHGHSLNHINELLNDQLEGSEEIVLSDTSLGGWSNINVIGFIGSEKYVVKFPPFSSSYKEQPYEYQYDILNDLAYLDIAPKPFRIGRLNDNQGTPFFIHTFLEGVVPRNLNDFSRQDLIHLSDTLSTLNGSSLRSAQKYPSAMGYLIDKLTNMKSVYAKAKHISFEVAELYDTLISFESDIERSTSLIEWITVPIHGDLQESNVVLGTDSAYLLDFQECFIGDPAYDICYLHLQNPSSSSEYLPANLSDFDASMKQIAAMVPMVLTILISWSIERLCFSEMDLVSPWLSNSASRVAVLKYATQKIRDLERTLQNQ